MGQKALSGAVAFCGRFRHPSIVVTRVPWWVFVDPLVCSGSGTS